MAALDSAAVSYAIVLTKSDEVKQADQPALIAATLERLRKRPAAYPDVFFTSARSGEGDRRAARPYRDPARRAGRAASDPALSSWPGRARP